jgi:hypothetical protein
VARGAESWTAVYLRVCVVFLLSLLSGGCGEGDGRKVAVECRTDVDCDASKLGVCDTVSCEDNVCVRGKLPDGQRCNDEDPLTREDACLAGACSGVQKVCENDLGPCLKAVHDAETDECVVEPVEDGVPCDDENACTEIDSCQAGECVGDEPKTCAASDECHVDGECDRETGACREVVAEDGAPCDDGQACTSADTCQAGACAGEAAACDDGLSCSVDVCDEASGACSADMAKCRCVTDEDCGDGNACNGIETCNLEQKLCQVGTPVECATHADPCLKNQCVPETGACEPEPAKDGTACDDENACTTRDRCDAGVCEGKQPVVCGALSQCHTAGTCDRVTGACSNHEKPEGSVCSDGNACSASDTCQSGSCVGSEPVACRASDQCHDAGVCNTATGSCSKPAKQNGVKCDDGRLCTSGDACQGGKCTPASQVVCTALDSCHAVGVCDDETGKCTTPAKPDGASCSDGATCTTTDVCAGGKCVGKATTCNDGIACTVDSCSEKLGGCTTDSAACPCCTRLRLVCKRTCSASTPRARSARTA